MENDSKYDHKMMMVNIVNIVCGKEVLTQSKDVKLLA